MINSETLRMIGMGLGFGINGVVWSSIPMIFYRPHFECSVLKPGQEEYKIFQCQEYHACDLRNSSELIDQNSNTYKHPNGNLYRIKQEQEYEHLKSISTEFNLFCENKIHEANIQSLGMVGQLLGSFLGIFIYINKHQQQNAFVLIYFTLGVVLFYSLYAQSIYETGIIFFIYNSVSSFHQCILFSHVAASFSGKLKDYGPTILNICWSLVSISYIVVTIFIGNWRYNMGLYLAPLSVLASVCVYFSKNQQYECLNDDVVEQQLNRIQDFKNRVKTFKQNKQLKLNAIIWATCFITGTICYYICALVLNTLIGDLYFNVLGSTTLELTAQMLSGLLILANVDFKKTLIIIFTVMGMGYSIGIFTQSQNDIGSDEMSGFQIFVRLIPIIIGKGTHELIWTVVYSYMDKIIPHDYQQISISCSYFSSIVTCVILPYYKQLMEYLQINSFVLLGFISIFTAIYCQKFKNFSEKDLVSNQKSSEIPLIDMEIKSNKSKKYSY